MPHINRTVYMPLDLLQAFSEHTGLFWSGVEIEGAICDAIAAAMQPKPVQKQLPAGTLLRASFGRKPIYAVVEGTEIALGVREFVW